MPLGQARADRLQEGTPEGTGGSAAFGCGGAAA